MSQANIAQAAVQTPGQVDIRPLAAIAWIERHARWILLGLVLAYVVVFFALAFYKYEGYGQGYDQVDFEQAIWNTTQGRLFEDSRFNFSASVFGMDWMPMLGLFVPFYAVLPSAHTLFFLQVATLASGAVPVYLLARAGSARGGRGWSSPSAGCSIPPSSM